jgi:hypothetical protein
MTFYGWSAVKTWPALLHSTERTLRIKSSLFQETDAPKTFHTLSSVSNDSCAVSTAAVFCATLCTAPCLICMYVQHHQQPFLSLFIQSAINRELQTTLNYVHLRTQSQLQGAKSTALWLVLGTSRVQISARRPEVLTDNFRGYPQFLHQR